MSDTWTIRRVVAWTAKDFAGRGITTSRLDAELLVAFALGLDRVRVYMELDRPLSAEELARVRELVARRRAFEPVAYIVGRREFYGRSFAVSKAVLIPRPDTETLVERALALLPGASRRGSAETVPSDDANRVSEATLHDAAFESHVEPFVEEHVEPERRHPVLGSDAHDVEAIAQGHAHRVDAPAAAAAPLVRALDLCTGSGAIGVTLAAERPNANVDVTDISPEALEVAKQNAAAHAVASRVRALCGDLFAAVPEGARYDLVTANPPYINDADMAALPPDVGRHEPHLALAGGTDGLAVVSRIAAGVGAHLVPGGALLVEVGAGQAEAVRKIFEANGLVDVRTHYDLARIERVVEGHAPQTA